MRKKPIPKHPSLKVIGKYLGSVKEPRTRRERMAEFIDLELVTGGFESFENGAAAIAEQLAEWDVEIGSSDGQWLLREYVRKALAGEYGDFDRSKTCSICHNEFRPAYSLEYLLRTLDEPRSVCPECDAKRGT